MRTRHIERVYLTLALVLGCTLMLWTPALAEESISSEFHRNIDGLWLLIAATLVFLMQAGFTAFEASCVPERDIFSIAHKNFFDWVIVSVVYLLVGFGFQYGMSHGGVIGAEFFGLEGVTDDTHRVGGYAFFLYQLVFAGTCATIVSGALTGRTSLQSHFAIAAVIGLFIYPVYGHWVWGSTLSGRPGFLEALGYKDFAGSSVVHLTGAAISLVGIKLVGPRLGTFGPDGKPVPQQTYAQAPIWGVLGTFLLWVGWIGFNGGSTLMAGNRTAQTVVATNMAGAAGAFVAFLHCYFFQGRKDLLGKSMGGALGGLVAVTAFAGWTGPLAALVAGCLAGLVHNLTADFLQSRQIDDPVNAIAVHGACGVLGILLVPFLAETQFLGGVSRVSQLGIQLLGAGVCVLWAGGAGFLSWVAIKKFLGLRVSPAMEAAGINFEMDDPHAIFEQQMAALDEAVIRHMAGGEAGGGGAS